MFNLSQITESVPCNVFFLIFNLLHNLHVNVHVNLCVLKILVNFGSVSMKTISSLDFVQFQSFLAESTFWPGVGS